MRELHLWIGGAGVVAFILTGQYMDRSLAHLAGMADLPRMLYRSGHIYLLFASLLNLLLGVHLQTDGAGWPRTERLASMLIAVAPVLLLIGFALEPARVDFERPFAGPAIHACFAGVLLQAVSRVVGRRRALRAPSSAEVATVGGGASRPR